MLRALAVAEFLCQQTLPTSECPPAPATHKSFIGTTGTKNQMGRVTGAWAGCVGDDEDVEQETRDKLNCSTETSAPSSRLQHDNA